MFKKNHPHWSHESMKEELTRFVMQLQATFGEDRVRAELRRLREEGVE